MSSNAAVLRLQKEYRLILKDPVPFIVAKPLHDNLLEWHYVMLGTTGTDYAGGVYHGKLIFPSNYPFKPPAILMLTPSGRFAVNTRLCLSMSDYHPESWNPMWSVASILTGLQSFFYEDTPTTGSVAVSGAERRLLAAASLEHNARVPLFAKMFAEVIEQQRAARAPAAAALPAAVAAASAPPACAAAAAAQAAQPQQPPLVPAAGGAEVGGGAQGQAQAAAGGSAWLVRAGMGLALFGAVAAVLAVPLLSLSSELT